MRNRQGIKPCPHTQHPIIVTREMEGGVEYLVEGGEVTDVGLVEVDPTDIWRVRCHDCKRVVRGRSSSMPNWAKDAVYLALSKATLR